MDLPRFHSGSLGPLGFDQINEMMRRLDAVLPLIEQQSRKQDGPNYGLPDAIPVYAKRGEGEYSARFSWKAIIVRGSESSNPDTIVMETDDDRDEIEEAAEFRQGKADESSYAISVDDRFDEGFAILVPYRRQDGRRSYVLFPVTAGNRKLAIINGLLGDEDIEVREIGGGTFLNASLWVYDASELIFGADNNKIYLEKRNPFALNDFSLHNLNAPAVPDGTTLIPRALDANTIVEYSTAVVGTAEPFHYMTGLPRFDVVCAPVQFSDTVRGIVSQVTYR